MKLPRDIDARQLIKALRKLDYTVTRQTGSHIRLACERPAPHALTIPNHSPIKPGTLNAILNELANQHRLDKSEVIKTLFG